MNHKSPKIGYLLKKYPRLSETFILNEILELERQGVPIHIFSLREPSKDDKFHPAVEKVRAEVTYIPSLLPDFSWKTLWSLLGANWQLLRHNTQYHINAFKFYFSRPERQRPNEFLQAGYLAWQLKKLGIAHLHAHFANVPTATAEIIERFGFINYSFTAHAKDIYLSEKEVLDRKIKKAKFVLTCSKYNSKYLHKLSTSDTPIYLLYNGLDLDFFQPNIIRQKERDLPLLLSVGRLCEKKGFPYLLQACQILKQKGYQFRCKIVGYGPMKEELEQLIETLEIGDIVSLVGQLVQDEIIQLYAKADMFALPCQITEDGDRDGIPTVLIEAMAMEVPVVSTDISGISELIEHEVNGLLIPEKDPKALAQELEKLLTQPQLVQQIKKSSRNKVLRQFSLDKNVKQIKDLFLGTTSNSKEQLKLESKKNLEVLTK
ncbi:MAG: glycosyltransferase [Xenococcus sp. MO_188.B8]|nr:glycosyltransferase [Xenococcus sp. MO_188.B8]